MRFIKLSFLEAKQLNERITNACITQNKWTDGITNNYCNPQFDEESHMWLLPILEGYESLFTDEELENAMK